MIKARGSRGSERRRFVVLLGVTAFGAAPAAHAQEGVPAFTLEAAIDRAIEVNPQVAQAKSTVESAEWSERRAQASYFPTLSASSSAGISGSGTIGGDPTLPAASGTRQGYGAGLSASMEIYSGGRRGAEADRSRAETTAAIAALSEREFATVLTTQRAFFDVARARDLVEVAESRLQNAEESFAAAERRMRVGSATTSDVLRAELEVSRARQSLLEGQNQLRNATFAFGRTIGLDGPASVELTERDREIRQLTLNHDRIVELVVESSPSVVSAQATLASSQASVRAASAQYLPRVSLSSGYDWSASELSFDESRTGWSLRLGMSIPIFDGFQREASVADARNRTSTSSLQLSDARRGAQAEAERLLGAVQLAAERTAISEAAVAVAEEDLRVQQIRYNLGTSTMLDQIASQTAVVEARQSLIAARYDYQIAVAELEALAGREL